MSEPLKMNPNLQGGSSPGRGELPIIIIHDRSELTQFFPTVAHQARLKSRAEWEWAMPCPRCGGDDRFIISNGMFWCRQCNYGGSLASLGDYKPLSPEEAAQMRADEAARKRDAELERNKAVIELTHDRIWLRYHQTLLDHPEYLQRLEADGINRWAVEHFKIGLCPMTRYWDGKAEEFRFCPSFTFPHFRWMVIGNVSGSFCTNIRHRLLAADIEGDKYRPHQAGLGLEYFPALFKNTKWGVLVEGEKKAIVLWSHGFPTIGIWGTHAYYDNWTREIQKLWPEGIYVIFDHDRGTETDPLKEEKTWKKSQAMAERVGGIPIQLPMYGKPDDLLTSGELSVAALLKLIIAARPATSKEVEIL